MKIAFYSHNSFRYGGGLEKQLLFLSKALRNKGHDVKLYSLPMSQDRKSITNISVSETSSWSHNIKADVAYITYHPFSSFLCKISCPSIAGIRTQVFFLKRVSPKYGLIPFGSNMVHRLIGKRELHRFSAVHVNNKTLVPLVPHNLVYYVPNFADSCIYKPYPKDRDFTVAFVGRACWQKGWDIFLRVVSPLKSHGVKVKCAGMMDETIEGISYLGFLSGESLARAYSSVHAVVYPTRADVFGSVIIESLLCGTPIVASRLDTRKGLELSLIYADNQFDIVKQILKLKEMWEKKRAVYMEICRKSRLGALKYDIKNVFPMFENMLIKVSEM